MPCNFNKFIEFISTPGVIQNNNPGDKLAENFKEGHEMLFASDQMVCAYAQPNNPNSCELVCSRKDGTASVYEKVTVYPNFAKLKSRFYHGGEATDNDTYTFTKPQ
jgi:hypothetical protein